MTRAELARYNAFTARIEAKQYVSATEYAELTKLHRKVYRLQLAAEAEERRVAAARADVDEQRAAIGLPPMAYAAGEMARRHAADRNTKREAIGLPRVEGVE